MNELMPDACCEQKPLTQVGSDSTVRGNLTRTKQRLEEQLAKVNAGLEILEKEPAFASNIETLLKAMRV